MQEGSASISSVILNSAVKQVSVKCCCRCFTIKAFLRNYCENGKINHIACFKRTITQRVCYKLSTVQACPRPDSSKLVALLMFSGLLCGSVWSSPQSMTVERMEHWCQCIKEDLIGCVEIRSLSTQMDLHNHKNKNLKYIFLLVSDFFSQGAQDRWI